MNKCFDYEVSRDTGNQPIMKRMCYCETTACCQKIKTVDYSKLDESKLDEYGIDQEKYYKEILKTRLL